MLSLCAVGHVSACLVESIVLIERALTPVHVICAVLQSVGVCRHLLEKEKDVTMGKLLKPAVLLHGTFDFVLTAIAFLVEDPGTAWVIGSVLAVLVMVAGGVYTHKECEKQRGRLVNIDRQISVDRSSLI